MKIPHNGVVLIADGRKSLFFRNEGDETIPNLIVEHKDSHESPPHRELASDLAGRVANVIIGHGGSLEKADFHQLEEDRFAAETAEQLKARALDNDLEALIVVAPPKTLGELRKHYHKEVEKRLIGEVAKDLVKVPVEEIERILQAQ